MISHEVVTSKPISISGLFAGVATFCLLQVCLSGIDQKLIRLIFQHVPPLRYM